MTKVFEFLNKTSTFESPEMFCSDDVFNIQLVYDCSGEFNIDVLYSNDKENWSKDNEMSLTAVASAQNPIMFDFRTKAIWLKLNFNGLTGTINSILGHRGR